MSRTAGAKNIETFVVQHPSRCRACQSTRRTKYESTRTEECVTTLGDGVPVTHITRHHTRCSNCGFPRIDVVYHNVPAGVQLIVPPDDGHDVMRTMADMIAGRVVTASDQKQREKQARKSSRSASA